MIMNNTRIVVVEDEPDILEVLSYNLQREGYGVTKSLDGTDGLEQIRRELPDLVLLDIMLPGIDGLEICRQLKNDDRTKNILIIIISAKGEESDLVLGLGIGADDYIAKPFSPREMIARVKAVLRRGQMQNSQTPADRIVIENLIIDLEKHKTFFNQSEIDLTATEFRLLKHLASNPGRVFSREQLLDQSLSNDVIVVDRNVDVHIRSIRKKLGEEHKIIETIRGVGYRFKDID